MAIDKLLLKTRIRYAEASGKTVKFIKDNDDGQVVILFEDDTYICLEAVDEYFINNQQISLAFCNLDWLIDNQFVDAEKGNQIKEQEEHKKQILIDNQEREIYERLKKKFENT